MLAPGAGRGGSGHGVTRAGSEVGKNMSSSHETGGRVPGVLPPVALLNSPGDLLGREPLGHQTDPQPHVVQTLA